MDKYMIDDVEVQIEGLPDVTEEEMKAYVDYTRSQINGKLKVLAVSQAKEPGFVRLAFTAEQERFERIRRITGYLVGTIDRWNNAKRAEEQDRYKHIR